MADPMPTTVGELAIFLTTKLESIEKQLEGLPLKVQALEFQVLQLKQSNSDRRLAWFTVAGWIVAIAGVVLGVVYK